MGEGAFWDSSPKAVQAVIEKWDELETTRRELDDWRAGTIAAEIANANERIKKRGGGTWEPRDFFPNLPEPERRPMDPAMMRQILAGWSGPEIKPER